MQIGKIAATVVTIFLGCLQAVAAEPETVVEVGNTHDFDHSFRLGLSAILQVNEHILTQRERLLGLSLTDLSADDRVWLSKMMARYGVVQTGTMARWLIRIKVNFTKFLFARQNLSTA